MNDSKQTAHERMRSEMEVSVSFLVQLDPGLMVQKKSRVPMAAGLNSISCNLSAWLQRVRI